MACMGAKQTQQRSLLNHRSWRDPEGGGGPLSRRKETFHGCGRGNSTGKRRAPLLRHLRPAEGYCKLLVAPADLLGERSTP